MVLKIGDQGTAVRDIQLLLAKRGYPLKGTGYFGSATDTAITDFQKRNGLTPDGEVGDLTLKALHATDTPTPAITRQEIERPLWLQAALGWVGTREQPGPGDNPIILNWAKDEGGDIAHEYNHDAIPWCALFANAVLHQVGLKGTGTLWALDFAGWGQRLPGPAVGAFAPMVRSGGGHIPIVVGRDQNGNIMCVGGNQSDAVNVKPFDPNRVVSWRWPNGVPLPANIGMKLLPRVHSDGRLSTQEA